MGKYIELEFVDQKIKIRARLLEEEMPRTCHELLTHLPLESLATHARYSGSEVAMLLSTDIKIDREKATSAVQTGDVAYVWLNQDDHYGLDDDVSEICWFYDKDSTPTMAEGPVRVNVFARIEGDASEFYKASADTRITGVKNVRISLHEE
jgi:hypothetical protein